MAEFVQLNLEQSLDEIEQLRSSLIFTTAELKIIINRRRDFEYKLRRKQKSLKDYIDYIEYEKNILDLIRYRHNDKIKNSKRRNTQHKENLFERQITNRIFKLYRELLKRYPQSLDTWTSYVTFAKSRVSHLDAMEKVCRKRLNKSEHRNSQRLHGFERKLDRVIRLISRAEERVTTIYANMIGHHGTVSWVWIDAVWWQYKRDVTSIDKVRTMMRKALEGFKEIEATNIKPNNCNYYSDEISDRAKLWLAFVTIELHYYGKMVLRNKIINNSKEKEADQLLNTIIDTDLPENDHAHDAIQNTPILPSQQNIDMNDEFLATNFKLLCVIIKHAITSEIPQNPYFILQLLKIVMKQKGRKQLLDFLTETLHNHQNEFSYTFATILYYFEVPELLSKQKITSSRLNYILELIVEVLHSKLSLISIRDVQFILNFISKKYQPNSFVVMEIDLHFILQVIQSLNKILEKLCRIKVEKKMAKNIWLDVLVYILEIYNSCGDVTFHQVYLEILNKLTHSLYPKTARFWAMRLQTFLAPTNPDLVTFHKVFQDALVKVKEKNCLIIWDTLLSYYENMNMHKEYDSTIDKAFKTLINIDVLCEIKDKYAKFLINRISSLGSIECSSNSEFQQTITNMVKIGESQPTLAKTYICMIEFLQNYLTTLANNDKTAKINNDGKPEINLAIDKLINFALIRHGKDEPCLWILYIKRQKQLFSLKLSSPSSFGIEKNVSSLSTIYAQAIKTLRPEKMDDFITLYTNVSMSVN